MNLIVFRYILKQFVLIFLATLFILTAVVLLFDTIELLREASKKEAVDFFDIIILALLKSPQMIHIILPFVFLIAALVFFLRFSRSSELIVMRSVGLSAWNFILPLVVFTFLFGIFDITIFNPISAMTAKQFERMEERVGLSSGRLFSLSEDGLWLREVQNNETLVIHASKVRQKDQEIVFEKVSVFEVAPDDSFLKQTESPMAVLSGDMLYMEKPFVIDPVAETSETVDSAMFKTDFSLDRILEKFDEPKTMSFWRFPKFIRFLKESGFSTVSHQMYWHELIAFPVFLVAMMLIAAVFALPQTTRQGKFLLRMVLAVLCGFLLYFLSRITNVLGLSQSLPMILAAWSPALIAIPLSISALLHLEDG
jgi:lipopolysaccharide export system permease protein